MQPDVHERLLQRYNFFLFLVKIWHPRPEFQSGVGLKVSLFKKMVVINVLALAFKECSQIFTSVVPDQDVIVISDSSDGKSIIGTSTPVQLVRPTWLSFKLL